MARGRARAPTPARDYALTSSDTLHLICAHLLNLNTLQAAAAVCKAWRQACRGIKGWRVFRREQHFISPPHRCVPGWAPYHGGPRFVIFSNHFWRYPFGDPYPHCKKCFSRLWNHKMVASKRPKGVKSMQIRINIIPSILWTNLYIA